MSIEDPRISATASENVSHDFRQDIHEDASIEASAREGVEVAQADNSQQPDKSDRVPAAPQVVAANAHPTEIVPDQNNVAHLPADVAIDDIRVEGNNLVLVQADGTEIVIVNGALHVPTFLLGEVELPQQAVIAALEQSNINVAAGPDGSYTASAGAPSSGAEFQDAIQPDPNDPLQLAQLLADTQQPDPGLGERRELFDDQPTIFADRTTNLSLTETEGEEGGFETQSMNGTFGFDGGANVGQITAVQFFDSLNMNEGTNTGSHVDLTSDGKPVVITVNGLTITGSVDGQPVFVLTVTNTATGAFTFTQFAPLDHPDKGETGLDDILRLQFSYTVTDKDGDAVTGIASVDINDGGPSIVDAVSPSAIDESDLLSGEGVNASVENVSLGIHWGADAGEHRDLTFSNVQDQLSGLKSDGQTVQFEISADGHTLTGFVGEGEGRTEVFVVTLDPKAANGAYSFTLLQPLDHPQNSETGNTQLGLSFNFVASDADGDTANGSFAVDVNDDVPTATGTADTVTEAAGAQGAFIPQTAIGNLDFHQGADGAQVTNITYRFDTAVMEMPEKEGEEIEFHALTSNGNQIVVTTSVDGLTVTGKVGDVTIFTLHVTDPKTGAYTFTQTGPIDHPDKNDTGASDTLRMVFDFTVTDGDGDKTAWNEGTLTIDINDDGPTINGVAQAANLLANGNFKDDGWQQQNWDNGGYAGSATGGIGWKVEGTGGTVQLERVSNGYLGMKTSNGAPMVDMGSSPGNTTISQDVVGLKAGETLNLSFEVGSPDTASAKLLVYWNNQLVGTFDNLSQMKLVTIKGLVASDTGSNQLTFKEVGTSDYTGTYLANISLTESANVPVFKAAVDEDKPLSFELAAGTQFSFGADGQGAVTLGSASVASASGISLSLPAGSYSYKDGHILIDSSYVQSLNAGEIATISIPFTVTDSDGDSKTGVYQITVTGENDAATITGTVTGAVTEDALILTTSGKLDIADVDHGEAHFQAPAPASLNGTYGTFTFNTATGAWTYVLDNAKAQVLGQGKTFDEKLTVVSADGTATQTITVKVTGVNDAPVAVNDTFKAISEADIENASWNHKLTVGNVLAQDSDVDVGDSLHVQGIGNVRITIGETTFNGTPENGGYKIHTAYGDAHLSVASDGTVRIWSDNGEDPFKALAVGETATIKFDYTVSDGHQGGTDTTTATITINGTNDAPAATNDVFSVTESAIEVASSSGKLTVGNVLTQGTNDSDVDGDTLHVNSISNVKVTSAENINFTVSQETGGYKIHTAFGDAHMSVAADGTVKLWSDDEEDPFKALGVGEKATISFTYQISDGNGGFDTATASIVVNGTNDAPVATDDVFSVTESGVEGASYFHRLDVGNVLTQGTNDSDVDGDQLKVSGISNVKVTSADSGISFNVSQENGGYQIRTAFGDAHLAVGQNGSVQMWSDSGEDPFKVLGVGETATITFSYQVSDGNGGTDTATATITVNGTNDAPVLSGGEERSVSIAENTNLVTTVTSSDVDGDARTYSIVQTNGTDFGKFTIDATTGELRFINKPDYENPTDVGGQDHNNIYVVDVRVSDGKGGFDTQTINVTVTNVNEAPVLSPASAEIAFTENAAAVRLLATAHVTDPDNPSNFNGGSINANLGSTAVSGDKLVLVTGNGITLSGNDVWVNGDKIGTISGNGTTNVTISLNSNAHGSDVDSVIKALAYQSTSENPTGADRTATITFNDGGNSGAGGSLSDSTSVVIHVTPVNDAAVLSSATVNLTEGNTVAAISTSGQLTISDVDSPATFVVQNNVAGTHGTFSIAANGAWTYTASSAHNEFQDGKNYTDSFTVTSADGTPTSVTINIAGTNDAAVLSADVKTLTEGDTAGAISTSGQLTITDVDSQATFVAQSNIVGNYGTFSIGTDGKWTYQASSAHNEFEAGKTYTETFTVSSFDGTTTSVAINIKGTNDAPIFDGGDARTVSVAEGTSAVTTVSSTDVDGSTPVYSIATANGTDYSKFVINSATGAISFKTAPNYEDPKHSSTYLLKVEVSDGKGGTDYQMITVKVTDVNEAPVLTPEAKDISYTENNSGVALLSNANLTDPDNPSNFSGGSITVSLSNTVAGDKLVVLAGSSVQIVNGSVQVYHGFWPIGGWQSVGTVTAGGVGSGQTSLTITLNSNSDTDDVKKVLQSLGFASDSENPTNADRTATITFNDGGHDGAGSALSDSSTVTIHVTPVNDAPVFDGGETRTVSVAEGTTAVTTVSSTDVDGGTPVYSIVTAGGTDYNKFVIDSATGAVSFKTAPNYEDPNHSSTYLLKVAVSDSKGGTDYQLITVKVTDVNEAPVLTLETKEVSYTENNSGVALLSNANLTDPDNPTNFSGGSITVSLSNTVAGDKLVILANSSVQIVNGNVQVYHSFGGWQTVGTVTAGGVGSGKTSLTITLNNNSDTADVKTVLQSLGFASDSENPTNADRTATVTFNDGGHDGAGSALSDSSTVTVHVNPVNDAPVFVGGNTISATVAENSTTVTTISSTDVDGGTRVYSIVSGFGDASKFIIDSATGAVSFKDAPNFEDPNHGNSYQLKVSVSDGNGGSAIQTINVTVANVNEAPIGVADTASVLENKSIIGTSVLANDTDPDAGDKANLVVSAIKAANGTTATVDPTGTTSHGQYGDLVIKADGTYKYTANALAAAVLPKGAQVDDVFTYTVKDTGGLTSTATITIHVTGDNNIPLVGVVSAFNNVDELVDAHAQSIHVSGQLQIVDFDIGDTETVVVGASTVSYSGGTLNPSLVADISGTSLLTFSGPVVSNGGVSLMDWSYAPPAQNFDFLAKGETITVTYMVQVSDGTSSTPTFISVTITGTNDAPVVSGAVTGSATEDGATSTLNALANASDVDHGAVLSVINVPGTLPAGVTYNAATHSFTLDPANAAYNTLAAGETTKVTVTYDVSDGTATTSASVSWTVTGTNDAPVVSGAVTGLATEGGAASTLNALENASDVDHGTTLSVVNLPGTLPAGVSYDAASKTFTLDPANAAYNELQAGEQKTVTVSYGVSDGLETTNACVSWTITGTNDAPAIVGTSGQSVAESAGDSSAQNIAPLNGTMMVLDADAGDTLSGSVTGNATALLNGGSLPGGVNVAALIAQSAIHFGTTTSNGGVATLGWTYDPAAANLDWLKAGDTLVIKYAVQVNDGHGDVGSSVIDLEIGITGTNDAPIVSGIVTGAATEGGAVSTLNALANASDLDHDTVLSVVNVPGTLPAGVTYDADSHSFRLDPTNTAYNSLAAGETTTVTVTYDVSDGAATTSASVFWTVTGTNDAPVVSGAVSGTATEGGAASTLNALEHASDVDHGTDLLVVNLPGNLPPGVTYDSTHKTFTLDPTNSAYDSLAAGEPKTVTVNYDVSDGKETTSASVTWTVTGTNDAPVITSNGGTDTAAVSINENATAVTTVTATDVDTAAAKLVYSIVGGDDHSLFKIDSATGVLSFNNAPDFEHPLDSGSNNVYNVVVQVSDGDKFDTQTINVTVNDLQENIAPVLTLSNSAYVLDQFNQNAYNGNNGTANWKTDWIEYGEDSGNAATTGDVRVNDGALVLTDTDAEVDTYGDFVVRTVDLTGATQATLTFDYKRESMEYDDAIHVQVKDSNGNWVEIATVSGENVNDASFKTVSVDLSAHISSATTIRFYANDDIDNGDIVYVDNVKIAYSTTPTFTEGGSATAIVAHATIADADASMHSAIVKLTNGQTGDVLSINGQDGSSGDIGNIHYTIAGGTITFTGDASRAAYQAAIEAIRFANTSDAPSVVDRTFQVTVNDGLANSNTATTSVKVVGVNDAPTVTATQPVHLVEQGDGVAGTSSASATLTLGDVDGTASYNTTALAAAGWTNAGSGVWTNSGVYGTATLSTAANTVSYQLDNNLANVLNVSDHKTESFTIPVKDDNGATASTVVSFIVDGSNDAPTVSNLSVSESGISFTIGDDNQNLSLVSLNSAFNSPTLHPGTNTLTPSGQNSVTKGTIQVTDGATSADVIDVALGRNSNGSGDTITASSNSTAMYGFRGNDTLTGGSAADWIFGGDGNDTLSGASNDHILDGGDDTDTLNVAGGFVNASDAQIVNIESVVMTSGGLLDLSRQTESIDITGTNASDTISASSGGGTINAGSGSDTVAIDAGTLSDKTWTVNLGNNDLASDTIVFKHDTIASGRDTYATVNNFAASGAPDKIDVKLDGNSVYDGNAANFTSISNAGTNVAGNIKVVELTGSNFDVSASALNSDTSTAPNSVKAMIASAIGSINQGTYEIIVYSGASGIVSAGVYLMSVGASKANLGTGDFTLDHVMTISNVIAGSLSSSNFTSSAIDPIILDLDHNGVALTTLDHGVQFDINADGHKDQIAWTAGTDGILAYDVDGNGKIDNGSEIFSPHFAGGSYVDGLAALSTLDSNHDGKIDAADEAFSKLTVWQDLNHNGITDSGELSSLADHSISSISLDANASNSEINGQSILADGSYTLTDGSTGHFVEVAFDTTLGGSENGSAYSMIGSDGDDILSGNGGMYTISGGAGADTFVLDTDALADVKLADVITDFKASEGDTLDVSKLLDSLLGHEASEAEALASVKTTVSGADTVVSVNANGGWHDVAVLQNVTEAVKILYDDKHDTTTAPHAG